MEHLKISCRIYSDDYKMFADIINQGIDSRLEAFTRSSFKQSDTRLNMIFSTYEVSILLRRLLELEDIAAGQWVDDIVYTQYGFESE